MKKITLLFPGLTELAGFSRQLPGGYLINTTRQTITGPFTEEQVQAAMETSGAIIIPTTDKVYSYS